MINMAGLLEALRTKYRRPGPTQHELAEEAGISDSYLTELLSGKCDVSGLTMKKINQLFPNATLNLSGDTVNTEQNHGHSVMSVNHGTVNVGSSGAANAVEGGAYYRVHVAEHILHSDDLSDEEKVRFLKILKRGWPKQ